MVRSLGLRRADRSLTPLARPLPMPGLHGGMRCRACLACADDNAYIAGRQVETLMATLTIRRVDPEVQKRLRIRAAQNGRSMEAELRQIINDAVGNTPDAKKETGRDL